MALWPTGLTDLGWCLIWQIAVATGDAMAMAALRASCRLAAAAVPPCAVARMAQPASKQLRDELNNCVINAMGIYTAVLAACAAQGRRPRRAGAWKAALVLARRCGFHVEYPLVLAKEVALASGGSMFFRMTMTDEPSATIPYGVLSFQLRHAPGPSRPFPLCISFVVYVTDIYDPSAPQCYLSSSTLTSHSTSPCTKPISDRASLMDTFATWPSSDAHLLAKVQAATFMFDVIEELFAEPLDSGV
jgi:hypothetical protein